MTGPRQRLDLALRPRPHGGSIVGVVLDHEGRPIAGAELSNPGNSSTEVRDAKTGPDGRFRLENLFESIAGKEVIVRARGSAPQRLKVEPGPPDKPAEVAITMEPGHRIKGRVTNDKGRPIEGVRVDFANGGFPDSDGGSTKTDVQGRFDFDSLPANSPFAFHKEGYSEIGGRILPLDTDDLIAVEMFPAGVILGRVVDARTGKPIRAFNVQITFSPKGQPGDPSSGLRSDLIDPGQGYQSDEGRFKIGDLVVGMPLQVMVSAQDHERRVAERVVVALVNEAPVEEFRLDPIDPSNLRTYRGRLVDAAGEPVVGAQLRLIAARDRDPNQRESFPFNWTMIRNGQLAQQPNVARFLESSTDARGRFEFPGIPRGTEVELAWWRKGIAPGRADHLEHHAEDREGWFDISLSSPARIVGTVDRKAYSSAGRIQVSTTSGGSFDSSDFELKPDQADFAFEDLASGQYNVTLTTAFERVLDRPGGLTTRTLATAKVTVDAGETGRVDFKP